MNVSFLPAGDLAILVEFEEGISAEASRRVRALEHLIRGKALPGVVETVPAFRSLLVYYDPQAVPEERLRAAIEALLPEATTAVLPPARVVEIPCCYDDPELGSDLPAVAERLGLSAAEVARLHSEADHLVYFIGFAPGQPYTMGAPEQLTIPRLETPRTKTPPGSVAIGGTQGTIYAVDSPGGFWVLGRTPLRIYDPEASAPVLLRPGDRLRFRMIARSEYDRIAAAVESRTYRPVIETADERR